MSKYDEIINQLRNATEASYELDLAIAIAVGEFRFGGLINGKPTGERYRNGEWWQVGSDGGYWPISEHSNSIDRSLELSRTLLPTHKLHSLRECARQDGQWDCELCHPEDDGYHGEGRAPSAPLAILIATFEALKEKGE